MLKLKTHEKALLLLGLVAVTGSKSGKLPEQYQPYALYGGLGALVLGLGPAFYRSTQPLPVEELAVKKHGQAFLDKTHSIEKEVGMDKGTLTSIMYSESGLNPQALEPKYGGGGLIGFMPSTTVGYGITQAQLLSLSAIDQLDYVRRFYKGWVNAGIKPESPEDWYLLTFFPAAVGKGKDYVIGPRGSTVYVANSALDFNKDGVLTVDDFLKFIASKERLAGTIFQA